jgi:hypothetical protein
LVKIPISAVFTVNMIASINPTMKARNIEIINIFKDAFRLLGIYLEISDDSIFYITIMF